MYMSYNFRYISYIFLHISYKFLYSTKLFEIYSKHNGKVLQMYRRYRKLIGAILTQLSTLDICCTPVGRHFKLLEVCREMGKSIPILWEIFVPCWAFVRNQFEIQ